MKKDWDSEVHDKNRKCILQEVCADIKSCEPVCGDWTVHVDEEKVWVDLREKVWIRAAYYPEGNELCKETTVQLREQQNKQKCQ